MTIELRTPAVDAMGQAVDALRRWQYEGSPMQLHPGDVGWFWRFGADKTAAAIRTWSRDGRIVAVGLLDGEDLLRLTMEPEVKHDEELTRQIVADVVDPRRGVLPAGTVNVEAPVDVLLQDLLSEQDGWGVDEPWTPLRRDLSEPVAEAGLRVETIGPQRAGEWAAVMRASFENSTLSEERWHDTAAGLPFADARCLTAYDGDGTAVAGVLVWSAGAGKPGVLEPMGVHRDHRGHGYGRAITVAAAAALRDMGASSAMVATPSSNVGAVATYKSGGFTALAEIRDLSRRA